MFMNLNFVNSPHQCLTWRMKKISNLDNIEKFLQLHYIGQGKEEKYLVHLTDEAPIIIVLTQKFVCYGLLDRTWTQQHNSESMDNTQSHSPMSFLSLHFISDIQYLDSCPQRPPYDYGNTDIHEILRQPLIFEKFLMCGL